METNSIQTKGVEEMTREELIELVSSLNKELESVKQERKQYENWWGEEVKRAAKLKEKIDAIKAFVAIL